MTDLRSDLHVDDALASAGGETVFLQLSALAVAFL